MVPYEIIKLSGTKVKAVEDIGGNRVKGKPYLLFRIPGEVVQCSQGYVQVIDGNAVAVIPNDSVLWGPETLLEEGE